MSQPLFSVEVNGRTVKLIAWEQLQGHRSRNAAGNTVGTATLSRTAFKAYIAARQKLVRERNRNNAAIEAIDVALKRTQGHGMDIDFVNKDGEQLSINGDTTLQELTEMGIKGIRLTEPGAPLPEGWWRAVDPEPEEQA